MDILNKKRIAVIGSKGIPSHVSGLEVYVQSLTTSMSDDFDITVFCRKRYCDILCHDYKGVHVFYIPSINTKHLDAFTYSILATLVASFMNFDTFWYQALGPSIGMPIPSFLKKNIVCTVHGLDWKRDKFGKIASLVLKIGERNIAKYADSIITLNKFDQLYFKKMWNRDTWLISNGIEEVTFRGINIISEKYGLKQYGYILFMSRIVPEKGVHVLVEAFKKTKSNKKLVIAGKGVHTSDYELQIKKLAKDDKRIIFTGFADGEVKEELYSNACGYILPSTIEGQSIGLLEAMNYKLPCIVSDIAENVDVVGTEGIVFKMGDVDSLAECIDKLDEYPHRIDYTNLADHKWIDMYHMTKKVFENQS